MSSHHIVKDKQEPALLIANGESCSFSLMQSLLEWSPTVVILDGAIDRVLELGIKADIIIGDFDSKSISEEDLRKVQFPIEIINVPDQEKTDLEKGLDLLIERAYPAVNIIWASGHRADHHLANLSAVVSYQSKIKISIIDDYGIMWPLLPLPHKFEKWYPKGQTISIIPFGQALGVSTSNLAFPLSDETLMLGQRVGISNCVSQEGMVEISYKGGSMLIMECSY